MNLNDISIIAVNPIRAISEGDCLFNHGKKKHPRSEMENCSGNNFHYPCTPLTLTRLPFLNCFKGKYERQIDFYRRYKKTRMLKRVRLLGYYGSFPFY